MACGSRSVMLACCCNRLVIPSDDGIPPPQTLRGGGPSWPPLTQDEAPACIQPLTPPSGARARTHMHPPTHPASIRPSSHQPGLSSQTPFPGKGSWTRSDPDLVQHLPVRPHRHQRVGADGARGGLRTVMHVYTCRGRQPAVALHTTACNGIYRPSARDDIDDIVLRLVDAHLRGRWRGGMVAVVLVAVVHCACGACSVPCVVWCARGTRP